MTEKLRILLLEDVPSDAELIEHELGKAGIIFTSERLETRKGFVEALESFKPDLILADYTLPKFDALTALSLTRKSAPLIPFIVITGSISEEAAVACMNQGADDYLLKDRLARLGEAVRNALEKRRLQVDQAAAEEALRNSENKFSKAFHASPDVLVISRRSDGLIIEANDSWDRLFGYSREEVIGRNSLEIGLFANPADRQKITAQLQEQTFVRDFEVEIKRKSGEVRHVALSVEKIEIDSESCLLTNIHDITERKRAEENIREARDFLNQIINAIGDPIFVKDSEHRLILVNDAECDLIGRERKEIIGKTDYDFFPKKQVDLFWQRDDQVLKTGKEDINEEQITDAENTVRTIVTKKTRYTDHSNKKHIVGVIRDISEIKRSEDELKRSEGKFRAIFDNASDGMFIVDLKSRKFLMCNMMCAKMLGYTQEEFVNLDISDIHPEEDLPFIKEQIGKFGRGEAGLRSDIKFKRNSGIVFLSDLSPSLLTIAGEKYLLIIFKDISERKRAEEQLRERDKLLQNLSEQVPGMIYTFMRKPDGTYCIPYCSRAIQDIFGVSAQDVVNDASAIFRAILPEDRSKVLASIENSAQTRTTWQAEYRVQLPGQPVRWTWGRSEPIRLPDGSILWYGFNADITERKRVEERLAESERKYRELVENANSIILHWTNDGRITFLNEFGQRFFGYSAEEIIGRHVSGSIVPTIDNSGNDLRQLMDQIRADPGAFEHNVNENMRHNGERVWIAWTNRIVQDAQGQVIEILSVGTDITERKKVEAALHESEERYRTLFEESKDAVYSTRLDGSWLDINPAGVELFGYPSREEMLAGNILESYVDPDERKKFVEKMIRSDFVKDYPLHMKKKDGRKLEIIATSKSVRNDRGEVTGFRGIMHDVTEARKLEQQLAQSQKMEAIGRLAGGIAHDFNNLLTVISGYGEMVLNQTEDGVQRENVQHIIHAARKAAGLTAQILSFSRKQSVHPEDIDLSKVVREFEKMIGRILGEDIELRVDLAADLAPVRVDISQFEQVILNIVVNARDAMTKGGKLAIETRNFLMDDDFLQEHPGTKKGAYVRLSITDNGAGMSTEVQEHIFEPFFTTKKLGEGTGLGLSTVYGIVHQASGDILIESEEGKGTTFHIFFPSLSVEADRRRSPKALSAGDSLPRGRETVLVVEDEEGILELITIVLSGLGYTVLAASGHEEAKAKTRESKGKIDLLLTDVVFPEMRGQRLIEEMKKLVPGIKVVLMSGYNDDRIASEQTGAGRVRFLAKPFTPQTLAKTVRQSLDDGE